MSNSENEKQKQPFHSYQGIKFQAIPVSPSETETPLQIVCFFDQSKNQHYAGGTQLVDEHFQGKIKELRARDHFHGARFETLLLTPKGRIPAEKLLLFGLGDPDTLDADVLLTLGRLLVQEAAKLNVKSFCFAPSLKDADVAKIPADVVSQSLVKGMMQGINTLKSLENNELIPALALKEIIFLAGAQHLETSQKGLREIFK